MIRVYGRDVTWDEYMVVFDQWAHDFDFLHEQRRMHGLRSGTPETDLLLEISGRGDPSKDLSAEEMDELARILDSRL